MAEPINRPTVFSGEIKVASRIVDYLSSGLYPSPAACLKELVNNSYDADATLVEIFVKPDADRIIIRDNGLGMDRTIFQKHFDRISESHKREDGEITPLGRPKIGKIGIGFIAANELCESMELSSTRSGSGELMRVTINFDEMRKPPDKRQREGTDYVKADYSGEILTAPKDDHFTEIYLERVRGEAREILAGAKRQSTMGPYRSLYGLEPSSVAKLLANINTWKDFDTYSETMLKIGLNVPVAYHDAWVPPRIHPKLRSFESAVARLNFKVLYDNSELRKPIVWRPTGRVFVSIFNFTGKSVAARGYFYAQHSTIKPTELHGLLIRIRNSAVGEFDGTFLNFSQSEFSLIQRWISCEIWADDRLEDALNIDRSTLRETHPAYVELRNAIHEHLRRVCADARSRIYEAGSKERRRLQSNIALEDLKQLTKKIRAVSPKAASALNRDVKLEAAKANFDRKLLRKFSVVQIYKLVVEAATETLSPSQLERFLSALARRLLK